VCAKVEFFAHILALEHFSYCTPAKGTGVWFSTIHTQQAKEEEEEE